MSQQQDIRKRFRVIAPALNERTRRLWAATEARAIGYGGVSVVARATKMSRSVIANGIVELGDRRTLAENCIRRPGGGRKKLAESDPQLMAELEAIIEPSTRGDPVTALRWTCKSSRRLAEELTSKGHPVSHQSVASLLRAMNYSLQANRKNKEGSHQPDRDAQFQFISAEVRKRQTAGDPVISVDTKKKELVGNFKNAGQEWRPKGNPQEVRLHDFVIKELGRAAPYGIYDLTANRGWVSVGINRDTASFAVESIRWWWKDQGRRSYPKSRRLMITADCGGSNGNRVRLWKWELQKLSDETGLIICVSHFPPGTSKWNKIEHRLFSFITQNWRGRPLVSHATIVNLIGATTTKNGLKVTCRLDTARYETGVKVSREQMDSIRLAPNAFHGEWNYVIRPHRE